MVVTGLGVVTPLGNNVVEFWENLTDGKSGVGWITQFDTTAFKTKVAAEVRGFQLPPETTQKKAKRIDRFAAFALAAAREAWIDAGLDKGSFDPFDVGVVIGSTHGGEHALLEEMKRYFSGDYRRTGNLLIPKMLSNMAAAQVAMELGLQGHNLSVSSACATGGHAIGEAVEIIKRGDASAMLCGGTEACITPLTVGGDEALKALSPEADEPSGASRPFDLHRNGFVLGEGAGVLAIEALNYAEERGARIYCEVTGYGATCDGSHETRPASAGAAAAAAMNRAIAKANIGPDDVSAVFAHATSTVAGDRAESHALRMVLGQKLDRVPVTAIKSAIGHALGASAAIQAVAVAKTIEEGDMPPILNFTTPDPDCKLNCVYGNSRSGTYSHVLSNSFGFGGHNASLVFSEFLGYANSSKWAGLLGKQTRLDDTEAVCSSPM